MKINEHDNNTILIPYRKKNKWGFCTPDKTMVIDCVFERTFPFINGIAKVLTETGYGYISREGENIVAPIYSSLYTKDFNLFQVERSGKYGLINAQEQVILPCIYEGFKDCNHDHFFIPIFKSKCGLVDAAGKLLIDFLFDDLKIDTNFLIKVMKGEKYGYINLNSDEIVPCIYDYFHINHFNESKLCIKREGKWGFVNEQGKTVIPFIYENAEAFKNGFAEVRLNGKYGYINHTGESIIPIKYDYIDSKVFNRSKNLFPAKKNGYYGYVDKQGIETIPFIYSYAQEFFENIATVELKGKRGCINNKGTTIIAFEYNCIYSFTNDIMIAGKGNKRGCINKFGELIIPITYDDVNIVNSENDTILIVGKGKKYGILNSNGDEIVPVEYDSIGEYNDEGFSEDLIRVQQQGKWGFVNSKGKLIIPCKYAYAFKFNADSYEAFKDKGIGNVRLKSYYAVEHYIDKNGNEFWED